MKLQERTKWMLISMTWAKNMTILRQYIDFNKLLLEKEYYLGLNNLRMKRSEQIKRLTLLKKELL